MGKKDDVEIGEDWGVAPPFWGSLGKDWGEMRWRVPSKTPPPSY